MNGNKSDSEGDIGFLFDLDGVLIDSEGEYTRIWKEIDELYPTGVRDFALRIKGTTLPEILSAYFPAELHGHVTDALNEREQKMKYPMLPGADSMLDQIESNGLKMALVTSSNNIKMDHLREEQPGLTPRFSAIVTADMVRHSKPDPEGYRLGASLIGIDPARCVVFEDSKQGVMAGKRAGCYVVGLTTTLDASILAPYADEIADTLADVDFGRLTDKLKSRKYHN